MNRLDIKQVLLHDFELNPIHMINNFPQWVALLCSIHLWLVILLVTLPLKALLLFEKYYLSKFNVQLLNLRMTVHLDQMASRSNLLSWLLIF